MKTFIRLILALVIGAAFADYNGMRPEYFSHLITNWGIYAYMGASLLIAWLSMPLFSRHFD
jgi:hypothetical protein